MIIDTPLPFVKAYIDELNNTLNQQAGCRLTRLQKAWLCFCLMGIILTNTICWSKFERASLGKYSLAALSWMFRKSKIPWDLLLCTSVTLILKKCDITKGNLVIDESDRKRSKCTREIFKTYKLKDKSSGGYVNGQTIVLLLLVTESVTLPVGFTFYMPDPAKTAWYKEDKQLKKQKVAKKNRPKEPAPNPNYPTKQQLALQLLKEFKQKHKEINVKAITADALYGIGKFMDDASNLFGGIQVISQLRYDQNVRFRNKLINVREYFTRYPGVTQKICIRGESDVMAEIGSARLHVTAHGKKRFVIALKYFGSNDYRYLVATDLSWCTQDIVKAGTKRWLIEVFFEDWKLYEGWGQEAKQPDYEGSSRGLILSLLQDHCLHRNPEQQTRLKNKLPAYTVGSLQRKAQIEALFDFISNLLEKENPGEKLEQLGKNVKDLFQLVPSKKHMSGKNLGRLAPSPSLKYKALFA